MKALTLKHPWAYAVAYLGKPIENRSWAPSPNLLKMGEWFAIHGGVAPKGRALAEAKYDWLCIQKNGLAAHFDLSIEDVITPGIVAACRFGGTIDSSDSPWFCGPVGWVLSSIKAIPEPIPCKGAQGLWDVPDGVLIEIRKQWRQM